MKKIPVLIIGAGPTGLMMAAQLAIQRIPFRIIETAKGPTDESRAIGIQARTLEIFSQMGIIDKFLRLGQITKAFNLVVNGQVKQHVQLSGVGREISEFPYLLILEQQHTERILLDFLKRHAHEISWQTELVDFSEEQGTITATLKLPSGKTEIVETNYLIGADGAHSKVRHVLGIPLAGKTYKQSLFVLDCLIESSLPKDEISVLLSAGAFAALFPMTHNRWRVVGEVPPSAYGKDTITFEEVAKHFDEQVKADIKLSDPKWISLYHSHHRCVSTFQKGNAFLLGDAAHIHSPVGAQGMNTGFQDAYNLAWKIAFVEQKKATQKLIETYNEERLPVARRLVDTVDRIFSLIVATNPLEVSIRLHVLPKIIHTLFSFKKTGNFIFRTVSQTGISYRDRPFAKEAESGTFPASAPRPGDRMPYATVKGKNIQDAVSATELQLLVFGAEKDVPEALKEVITQYDLGTTYLVQTAETRSLYKRFGVTKDGFYLIRPDRYIAYRSSDLSDTKNFRGYLSRFFLPHSVPSSGA